MQYGRVPGTGRWQFGQRRMPGGADRGWGVAPGRAGVVATGAATGLAGAGTGAARGTAGARISVVGKSAPEGAQIVLRVDPGPERIVPPVPEERSSGDPHGAVLGFSLAETIVRAHEGAIEERDGALFVMLPSSKS